MLRDPTRPVRVHRLAAVAGTISLLLTLLVAAPVAAATPGDAVGSPIPIATADFGTPQDYDTTGATEDAATDPSACEADSGMFEGPFTETVWHAFTPDADGALMVDVNSFPDPEAPGFLAILFVFADDGAGGVELVACSAFPAMVQFEAVAGTTYYAMTGSLPETPGGGPAVITVAPPILTDVSLDERAEYDPQDNTITITGTAICGQPATLDAFVFASQTIGTHTVGADGFGFVDACDGESAWSATITGFAGPLNPGRIDVSVDLNACSIALCSFLHIDGTVRAIPSPNRPGPPEPPPPPAPPNDEPSGALPIALGGTATQDTTGATSGADDPSQCPDEPVTVFMGHTVWYAFTAAASGWVEVNTIGSDYDTSLFVLDQGAIVRCDDDIVLGSDVASQLTFRAVEGTTYAIVVGAWQDSAPGSLTLNVLEGTEPPEPPAPPANDDREHPIELVIGEPMTGDNATASSDLSTDPEECLDDFVPFSDHTVWYSVTADADGWLSIEVPEAAFDSVLWVLDGAQVIGCGGSSELTFETAAGSTYLVMLGTYPGAAGGAYSIVANEAEAPFAHAVTIDPFGTLHAGSGTVTITGSASCSEPGTVEVNVFASQTNGRFTVFGDGFAAVECGPEPTPWSVTIVGGGGRFQNGDIGLFVESYAFGDAGDSFLLLDDTVSARPGRRG